MVGSSRRRRSPRSAACGWPGTARKAPTRPRPRRLRWPRRRPALPAGAGDLGDTYYAGIGNGGYDVSHYDLNLKYNPDTKWLDGKATITAATTQHLCRFNLDLRGLTVSSVKVDGWARVHARRARADHHAADAVAALDRVRGRGPVRGEPGPAPRDPDGFLDGWNYTEYGAYTSTPPQGADTWYPNNNTTNDKAAFTFTVTVPADRQVMSNGIWSATRSTRPPAPPPGCGTRPTRWRPTSPRCKIGKYTIQRDTTAAASRSSTASGRTSSPPTAQHAAGHDRRDHGLLRRRSSARTRSWRRRDRRRDQRRLPDGDSRRGRSSPARTGCRALAHELAHQWFGDSVAVRRVRDVWLSEGFATFAAWMWTEHDGRHHRQAGVPQQLQPHRHVLEQHGLRPGRREPVPERDRLPARRPDAAGAAAADRRREVLQHAQRLRTRRSSGRWPRPRTSSPSPSASPARTCATSSSVALHAGQAEPSLLLLRARPRATSAAACRRRWP